MLTRWICLELVIYGWLLGVKYQVKTMFFRVKSLGATDAAAKIVISGWGGANCRSKDTYR
jgi:hypothetical protein